jgi:hypothetical protein
MKNVYDMIVSEFTIQFRNGNKIDCLRTNNLSKKKKET